MRAHTIYTINNYKEVAHVGLHDLARVKDGTMEIEKIAEYVTIFLSSGVGATILGLVIRSIAIAVSNAKIKKYSKLTDDDKKAIADEIMASMKGSLKLDADAMVDKATNSRLSAIESSHNDIVNAINQSLAYSRATMNAVGDFKTISEDSRTAIKELLKEDAKKVEAVKNDTIAEISYAPANEDKQATAKVSY